MALVCKALKAASHFSRTLIRRKYNSKPASYEESEENVLFLDNGLSINHSVLNNYLSK